jgi:hypothetical protein
MSSNEFVPPKLIKSELIEELDSLVGQLSDLTAMKPKPTQEAHMDARLADFLELAEQDFIRGWTDWEEGIQHKKGQSEAYNAGYADCYEYENKGGQ